jgi:hypothetical protein
MASGLRPQPRADAAGRPFSSSRQLRLVLLHTRRGRGGASAFRGRTAPRHSKRRSRLGTGPGNSLSRSELVSGNAGIDRQQGFVSYFKGNDPRQWQQSLPSYGSVVYRELYPGVDLYYDDAEGLLKGTYVVAPGTDLRRIHWRYTGARSVRVDESSGDLNVVLAEPATKSGELVDVTVVEHAPVAWQEVNGGRQAVPVRFDVASDGSVGFVLGSYRPELLLTIDPTLGYSTYLGGAAWDVGVDIAIDPSGSSDFPGASGTRRGTEDAFVVKLNAAGDVILYSLYLGGSARERAYGIDLDAAGNVYIVGETASTDFPRPTCAGQPRWQRRYVHDEDRLRRRSDPVQHLSRRLESGHRLGQRRRH